ncbi:MAG: PEP-CTERM sorting domain-containing protein [Planctomycetota bacterium]|jgi:hypothetical protein
MSATKNILMLVALLVPFLASATAAPLLNEFHYDNAGSDVGEFLEVVLTGAANASNVTVTLYTGSTGLQYDTHNVGTSFSSHGTLADGNRYYSLVLPSNGIQNGSPDGIAVDLSGAVAEFWSYEGTFTAADGPANGLTSVDVGVEEPLGTTPVGSSLQRINFGNTWVFTSGSSTLGAINIPEPMTLSLLMVGAGVMLLQKKRRKAC